MLTMNLGLLPVPITLLLVIVALLVAAGVAAWSGVVSKRA